VYLDDDAYLDQPGLLQRVVRAFEEHEDMGIAAFRIVDHVEEGTRLRLPISRWQQWGRPEESGRERPVSVFLAGGYAIRAEVMTVTGGYEEFFWYMGEEQDLSFKALEEGYTIWYIPDVRVEHEPGGGSVRRSDEPSRLFYSVRNRAYLARHHLPRQYLPSYLTWWLFVMAGQAVLTGDGKGFLQGLQAAWSQWTKWPHNPLSDSTLRYLRRHGGRLWF
jgi:GT2 family glycosyltransferase